MKLITNEYIKSLNPSDPLRDNYLKYYPNSSFTMKEFLQLEHLSDGDKIYIAKKFNSPTIQHKWVLLSSTHLLPVTKQMEVNLKLLIDLYNK